MLPAYALAPYSHFHFAYEFITRRLAYVLDSLVRVSRRVGKSRFGKIFLRRVFPSLSLIGAPHLILPFAAVSTCIQTVSAICLHFVQTGLCYCK